MTDSQTPERPETLADDCRLFADSAERQGTPWGYGCASVLRLAANALIGQCLGVDGGASAQPGTDMPANPELSFALRSAEARGRVQGLREAADKIATDVCPPLTCAHFACATAESTARRLRAMAEAIEQGQH